MLNTNLQKDYGISLAQYEILLQSQQSVCYICLRPSSNGKSLSVDHDHKTGRVRNLLCHRCNTALGMLDENIDRMKKMIDYIIKHTNPN